MEHEYTVPEILIALCNDSFTGFAMYTFGYFILRTFTEKERLREFDKAGARIVIFAGILYFAVWMYSETEFWLTADEASKDSHFSRITGKYWFGYWLQPLTYVALSQSLWKDKLRENVLTRFMIAFFLFLNYEKFVIVVTSLHRDYLPGSWTMYSDSLYTQIAFGFVLKIVQFCFLAWLLFFIRTKKEVISQP